MATLLPLGGFAALEASRPQVSDPGFVGWASDLVDCDAEVRPAIDLLLSRIAVVRDPESARRLQSAHRGADVWFATAGLRLHGTGIASGGKGSGKEMGLLRRAQMTEDFQKALEEAKAELATLAAHRAAILASRQAQESRRREIEPALSDARRREAASQGELRQIENQSEGMEARLRQSSERVEELRRALDELQGEASRAAREVEVLSEERAVRDAAASRAEEARREAEEAIGEVREALRETEMRLGTARAEILRWESEMDAGERRSAEILAARERLRVQDEGFEGQVDERTRLMEDLAREVDRLKEVYRLLERTRDQAKEVYDSAVLAVEEKLSGVKGHQRRLEELGRHLHGGELVKAQADAEIRSLVERAFQAHEVDLDDPQAFEPVPVDPGTTPAEIDELKGRLKALGPVNPAALEEFEAERERMENVQKQYDDLEKAKNGLERAIKRLDKLARDKFMETFSQVQRNFQQVFSSLFGGGEAKLELEENVDPLEARIEINARPLGKAMRGVALLSGGERALTATSLLFALYLIRPSPYCILDEVDGPLDDANIGRFVDLLRKFSHQTQFIVVTHNKRTMAASDMLYGVTQEIKGISQLASVQLDEAERFAA
jgi:chromosome segregation protein